MGRARNQFRAIFGQCRKSGEVAPQRKTTQSRGMVSAPFCELKTCTPATCSAWLLAIFRGKLRVAILLLVVGVTPTGNRDAGKFAALMPPNCRRVANPKA